MRLGDVKTLWGQAAGRCANPACREPLVRELLRAGEVVVGEQAHIIARRPGGPRGAPAPPDDSYTNRILLCPDCHTLVDKAPQDFPVDLLVEWKTQHERWVQTALPAALKAPLVWFVPRAPNPAMEGRDEDLDALASRLSRSPIQALHGLPGVGKSHLAARFAVEHGSNYSLVWWLDASTEITLAASLRRFAEHLDIAPAVKDDPGALAEALRRWLAENGDWLLLIDDASNPAAIEALLPGEPAGHVVVTSTHRDWRRLAEPAQIDVLPVAPATRYLLRRTGRQEDGPAEMLATVLGGLPVALEQAAAYVATSGGTLAAYSRLFEEMAGALLASGPAPTDYGRTVTVTVQLALQSVEAEQRNQASGLIRLLAFCGPGAFPRWALAPLAQPSAHTTDLVDEVSLGRAVGALGDRSLLDLDPETVTLHGLVSEVVRDGLTHQEQCRWASAVQSGLRKALGSQDPQLAASFDRYSELLPHVLAACRHAERLDSVDRDTIVLLDRAATHLRSQGEAVRAKELFERAVRDSETLELDADLRFEIKQNLGDILVGIDPSQAREALTALLTEMGSEATAERSRDLTRAYALTNRAFATYLTGAISDAETDNSSALAVYERALSEVEQPNSNAYVDTVNNAGLYAWAAGRRKDARQEWQRGLDLLDRADSADPLQRARLLANLGVLEEREDPRQARRLHQQAHSLRTQHLPADHPDVIQGLINLGGALRAEGVAENDQALLEEALDAHERAEQLALHRHGGDDSLERAEAVHNQALDLWRAQETREALRRIDLALALFGAAHEPGHPVLLRGHVARGRILLDSGEPGDAAVAFDEVLRQADLTDLPRYHEQVALAHDGLGRAAAETGDRETACKHFRLSYEGYLEGSGKEAAATKAAAEQVARYCG